MRIAHIFLAAFVALSLTATPFYAAWASKPVAATGPDVAAAHGEPADGGGGFPQLDTTTYASQIFWLAVAFVLMYLLMSRTALPSVEAVLDKRDTLKNGNLDEAEKMGAEAEKLRHGYEESLARAHDDARQALSDAATDISAKIAQETQRFSDDARKRLAEAEARIDKARAEAAKSLSDVSADIAADMVARICGANISKADAQKAVAAEEG